ncbi:phosphoglycerate mutase [Rhizobium sp. R72]|uniref:histidine phosphatase family protein n=1 Tax=unclassified Rhizobium TaxID=2613769 RepID=UPI000B5377EA|nr:MULTISPECIES: histidine phosphatase family protein [unclassified Rhizobium]OWV92824.1 phosphoglycerate mutase [Rhizobium sp. R72]OWV93035.1 phosphoglycerate mutase [Rhizobium sp. R711]
MTTTFFLVRHAAHDNLGSFLAGRMCGIGLGAAGQEQAARLAKRLAREKIDEVYTSPQERTRQTAAAIATACALDPPQVHTALDEVDFGSWTGRRFDDLNGDQRWQHWNALRSLGRAPGGERMLDVQHRVLGLIETLAGNKSGRKIVLVSHSDVIKAAVTYVLGSSLDAWARLDVAPGSLTVLVAGDWGAKIAALNEVVP